jgi:hypothetical protein
MPMEWYTLDDNLQRFRVIEGFESFIWTERYAAQGDFEIVINSNHDSKSLLQTGTRIGMKGSYRVMTIDTVSDELATDGVKKLTVTGKSMENLLDDRVAMPALDDLTAKPKWTITGTPGYIARYIFSQICVTGVMSPNDTIPFYHSGTLLPPGNIPEPNTSYTIDFDPDTVYNDLVKVCEIWSIGFRLVKNGDLGQIYFEVYTGSNRTSFQTILPPVIFSQGMDSISKTSTLRSLADLKTVAYVLAANDAIAVYADGVDSSVTGSARRVLLVKADDIDLAVGAPLTAAMQQRGLEELAKHRALYAFDGEIPQHQPYTYGVDYNLGDLVEERSPDGFISQLIVTEQIFVSDSSGELSYPTLTLKELLLPGTWVARPIAEHWADVPDDQYWGNQP